MELSAIALLWLCSCGLGEKTPLHFSYITSKTGSFVVAGSIPVVDLALEQINGRTDILPNYTLSYTTILDSKCDGPASLDSFFEHFRSDSTPTYVSLLCCGCSPSTIPVAEISHYWNVPQIAGIAAASELNNRQRFRGFYRTDASSEFVGAALAEIARQFNWTQMAIISQSDSLFFMIKESLSSIFKFEQLQLDSSIVLDKNTQSFPYHLIDTLAEGDYRIIILNTDQPYIYAFLCEAFYRGWFAPKYVWITYTWLNKRWWDESNGNSSCNSEILRKMVNNSLAVGPSNNLMSDDRHAVTFSGLTPAQYEQEYTRRLQEERYQAQNLSEFILAGSKYDATWAMALGLHNASERIKINDSSGCDHLAGELVPLEDFDYLNDRMGCVLRNSFQQVNFLGITGPVVFNSNGSRDANVLRVQQYHVADSGEVERVSVAEIVINTNSSEFIFKNDTTSLWPDGVPYDGAAREQLHPNSPALVAIYSAAAIAGIVYAVVCLLFNIVFRNRKVVKLSSRNLNYLIVTGAILLYVSVPLYIFSEHKLSNRKHHDTLCNIRQVLFSLGYTLCFAVILVKTWRVYHIFSNPKPNKKVPKDWFLLVIVVLVVAGDLVINLIGTVVPSSRLLATLLPDERHPVSYEDGIRYDNYVYICLNSGAIVWLAISYAYKGFLQLVAMFMAFHTRRVKVKVLNDSKEIAVIVYVNSIILALLAVNEFALSRYHEVHAALFGLALLVEPTVFLTLVYIPMMVRLYKDPKGETTLEHPSTPDISLSHRTNANTNTPNHHTDEVASLKQQVSKLKKQLAKFEKEKDGSDVDSAKNME